MLGLFIIFALVGLGFWAGYIYRGLVSRRRRAEYLTYEPYLPSPSRSHVASANGDIFRSLHGTSVNVHAADSSPLNAVDTWAETNSGSAAPDRSILGAEDIEELIRRLNQDVEERIHRSNRVSNRWPGMARGRSEATHQGGVRARHRR
jgi:hypothetical protein